MFWSSEKLGLAILDRLKSVNVNDVDDLQEINITHESGLVRAINFTLGLKYRLMYNSPFGDSIIQGGQKLDISEELCKKIKEQLDRLSN
jgi:hypothetical protein